GYLFKLHFFPTRRSSDLSVVENNLDFGLWIKDKVDKEQYHLGAKMQVTENNYVLSLNQDGLMLNYEKWQIDPANRLHFGSDGIQIGRATSELQSRENLVC